MAHQRLSESSEKPSDLVPGRAILERGGAEVEAHSVERKLAAIFAADVEGYSRLMGLDEVGTLRTLTAYRVIITPFGPSTGLNRPTNNGYIAPFLSTNPALRSA